MPEINDRGVQDIKPYSLQHIFNQSFDRDAQVVAIESLEYNPAGNSSEAQVVRAVTKNLAMRVDDTTTANVVYIGHARIGEATDDAVWRIKRIDESSGVVITWADGNASFDNVWDNRASLTYT